MIKTTLFVLMLFVACAGADDQQEEIDAGGDGGASQTGGAAAAQGGTAGGPPEDMGGRAGGSGGEAVGGVARDAGVPPVVKQDASITPDAQAPVDAKTASIPAGTCTQIIGMSITAQWSLLPGTFERLVEDGAWQMLIRTGRGVGAWADPNFDGWSLALQSPCARNSAGPDRVLFELLSAEGFRGETDPAVIEAQIKAMLVTLKMKLPSVKVVILQPVIGGPQGKPCARGDGFVMASIVHPAAVEAIQRVVQADRTGSLYMSFVPTVRTCDDYIVETGNPGHLVREARPAIAEMMAGVLGKL
ncbi:MAG: hypothetical protein SF187_20285 [Deltaproteobacteria bacterium]|nr:hypothetical protein [Deltaproteobacteria bacterium]